MSEFLIWSEEHGAWWRPGWAGYTSSIVEAGRYDEAEASLIVTDANVGGVFHEIAIPVPAGLDDLIEQAKEKPHAK